MGRHFGAGALDLGTHREREVLKLHAEYLDVVDEITKGVTEEMLADLGECKEDFYLKQRVHKMVVPNHNRPQAEDKSNKYFCDKCDFKTNWEKYLKLHKRAEHRGKKKLYISVKIQRKNLNGQGSHFLY